MVTSNDETISESKSIVKSLERYFSKKCFLQWVV